MKGPMCDVRETWNVGKSLERGGLYIDLQFNGYLSFIREWAAEEQERADV